MKTLIRAVALAAPLAFAATAAFAHAHLTASTPAKDATVAAPKAIHLEFSEGLEAKFSGLDVKSAAGHAVPVAAKVAGKAMDATPKAALTPGAYTVEWHALSTDGHKSNGSFGFTVK
jgi:methionine-rich copper-binding protein CopC